jgi:hypothetical protein
MALLVLVGCEPSVRREGAWKRELPATVTLTGGPVRLRPLFAVPHRLFMQPAAGMTYDAASGLLEALWQDPGSAPAPQDIAAQAPLYLSAAPVN